MDTAGFLFGPFDLLARRAQVSNKKAPAMAGAFEW